MAEVAVLHLLFTLLQWMVGAVIALARAFVRLLLGVLEIVAWSIGAIDRRSSPAPHPAPTAATRWRVHAAWR